MSAGRPWTEEEDAVLLAWWEEKGAEGVGAMLGRAPTAAKSRAVILRAQGAPVPRRRPPGVRPASEFGLEALGKAPPPDAWAMLREPEADERRRSRCRQLARDIAARGNPCWQWTLCSGSYDAWTPAALESLLALGPEWFRAEGGSWEVTERGRRELLGEEAPCRPGSQARLAARAQAALEAASRRQGAA